MFRFRELLVSRTGRLSFVMTVAMLLMVEGYSQEILTSLDRRSLKGKIDPNNNSPMLVEIADGGYRFSGVSLSKNALLAILNDEMDKRMPGDRIIFVTTDAKTPFARVVDLLKMGRTLDEDDFSLTSLPSDSIFDPASAVPVKIVLEEPEKARPKPGPRFLGVEISEGGSLSLNGKILTETALMGSLKQVFDTRKKRRIYIQGSRDVDKTVFVRAILASKFEDLIRALKTVQSSGAYPIALEIDWLS